MVNNLRVQGSLTIEGGSVRVVQVVHVVKVVNSLIRLIRVLVLVDFAAVARSDSKVNSSTTATRGTALVTQNTSSWHFKRLTWRSWVRVGRWEEVVQLEG